MTERFIWDDEDPPAGRDAEEFEGPATVPVRGLDRTDLGRATGFTRKRLDALIRQGRIPVASSKARTATRFDLPAIFSHLFDGTEAELDPLAVARRQKTEAEARRIEIQNKKAAGELVEKAAIRSDITRNVARLRTALLDVPARLTGHPEDVRQAVLAEIVAAFARLRFETMEGDNAEQPSA